MELFGLDAVEVSEHDILRGAAWYLQRTAPPDLSSVRRISLK